MLCAGRPTLGTIVSPNKILLISPNVVASILFSIIPILPQYTIVVCILFSIIPILPQYTIVVSILFSIIIPTEPFTPEEGCLELAREAAEESLLFWAFFLG